MSGIGVVNGFVTNIFIILKKIQHNSPRAKRTQGQRGPSGARMRPKYYKIERTKGLSVGWSKGHFRGDIGYGHGGDWGVPAKTPKDSG